MTSANLFFPDGVFQPNDFKSSPPHPFISNTNDLTPITQNHYFVIPMCITRSFTNPDLLLVVPRLPPNSGLPSSHPKSSVQGAPQTPGRQKITDAPRRTPPRSRKGETTTGLSDGHNFQTPSSPLPKKRRFTLISRKAVATALAEPGPVTKKLPHNPVTIATLKSSTPSLFPRYFSAARHARGPEAPPFREPALSFRDLIGRLSPASSCGRSPTFILFFFSSFKTRPDGVVWGVVISLYKCYFRGLQGKHCFSLLFHLSRNVPTLLGSPSSSSRMCVSDQKMAVIIAALFFKLMIPRKHCAHL